MFEKGSMPGTGEDTSVFRGFSNRTRALSKQAGHEAPQQQEPAHFAGFTSHNLTVLSSAKASVLPSGLKATDCIEFVWPSKVTLACGSSAVTAVSPLSHSHTAPGPAPPPIVASSRSDSCQALLVVIQSLLPDPPALPCFRIGRLQVNRQTAESAHCQRQCRQRLSDRKRFAPQVDFVAFLPVRRSIRRGV